MDFIAPKLQHTEDGRIIIELYDRATQTFMGVLYYEKAKNGFTRKPVGLNKMACVDAKIETLFNLHPHLQPKDVLDYCQSLVEGGNKDITNI
jgi:hypothetical protein